MMMLRKQPRVRRRHRADGVLDGADRGDGVNRGADAADPLRESPGVARIAAAQNQLDAAKHRRRRPRLLDHAAVDFRLDAKMTFDPRDGIDNDMRHYSVSGPSSLAESLADLDGARLRQRHAAPQPPRPDR